MKAIIGGILVTGALLLSAPTAAADPAFSICPSGSSGVIGEHTSCAFADVVAGGYYRHGSEFNAYSPVTGQWYRVECVSGYLANFTNGAQFLAARCFAGNDAQVVVW